MVGLSCIGEMEGGFSNAPGEQESVESVDDDRCPTRDPELVLDESEDVVTGDPAVAHTGGVAGFKLANGGGWVFEGVDDVTGFGAHGIDMVILRTWLWLVLMSYACVFSLRGAIDKGDLQEKC